MPEREDLNNAKSYQDGLIQKHSALIVEELARLREARACFNSLTALSKAVAKNTGLTDVTLRRNNLYRNLLLNYLKSQGGRSGYASRSEAELNELRHKVTELELSLSNTKAETARLRAFCEKMDVSDPPDPQPNDYIPLANSSDEDWEHNCQRTYYLVQALLSRAFFVTNFEKNIIEDPAEIGDEELVAGSNLAKPYIDWCRSRESNGAE
ncbi:hypothetical protein [Sulfitobacter dubius]|uniref:Uncharacterized protein n=1 Tax=Sulfitobacter dubius TaxID=218673 RepID=A0ABY3ZPB6_9RHOB|nr:hypothetical protein [Sulfitobacter dubius]UOA15969.1 hypothetical protein DSM109990_02817 [Sulfitobacter dubius]